jgi:hypothetical protein
MKGCDGLLCLLGAIARLGSGGGCLVQILLAGWGRLLPVLGPWGVGTRQTLFLSRTGWPPTAALTFRRRS